MARTCILRAFGLHIHAMTFFSGVTFVLFCFVFVFILSLKPRPFIQSPFDMQAPRYPHVFLSFFFSFCSFGDVPFSEYFLYHCRFLFVWRIRHKFFPFELPMFFYLVTTGCIFYISFCERIQSTNQSNIRRRGRRAALSSTSQGKC